MIMNEIINVISTLGFPIAACVFMAWYLTSKFEKLVEGMLQTQKEFRASIDANSKLVNELIILVKEGGIFHDRREEDIRD